MKIVQITRSFKPNLGGVENHIENISKLLSKDNSVEIITESSNKDSVSKNKELFSTTYLDLSGVSQKKKKWLIWKWVITNKKIFMYADIIHCHDVVFWIYPLKILYPLKKIYCTFHGWEGKYPIPLKNIIQKKFDSLITSGNICVGDFISKWYKIRPNYVTYGAVNVPKKTVINPENTLLFLGRLDSDTGFHKCIELYKSHKEKLGWNLVIAGDGNLRSLIPKDAMHLGWIENVNDPIQKSKYVYTTGYLGILEALVNGKPVITSFDNPVKKDYIQMHPMFKYFHINEVNNSDIDPEAVQWAKMQTWDQMVSIYKQLWKIQ